jgi:hypothetical protein
MFISDPDITHPGSRISDPGSNNSNKRDGRKKFVVIPCFVTTNLTKFYIFLFLICRRKKFGPIFQELLKFLLKKLSLSSKKRVWDPGSEIRKKPILDPGSRGQKGTGSGSATLLNRKT